VYRVVVGKITSEAPARSALRWAGSFTFALTLHVLAIGLLFGKDRVEETSAASLPVITVELAALPELEIVPDEAVDAARPLPPPPPAPEASAQQPTEPTRTCDPHAPLPEGAALSITLTEWKRLVQGHLDRLKQYPADAQRNGQQGTPHVFFTVCHDGRVLAAHIVRTSGFASLDQAGMDLVRRAEPLPRLPPGQSEDVLHLVVPVEFSLKPGR